MNLVRCALVVLSTLALALAAAVPAGAKGTLPDLTVTKVSKPPKTLTLGTKLKLGVKVANLGGPPADASKLGLYLAKGKKHTKKDKRLKRVKVKALAGGKSQKLKVKLKLSAKLKPGVYRLFACADDSRQIKEAKEGNDCRGTKKLRLVTNRKAAANLPATSTPPPAAAFSMSDGIDWGQVEDAKQHRPEPGDPVTVNLTAGNGIPGQAGYNRTEAAAEGFRSGNATPLDYSGTNNSEDDGQVTVSLPFAFPFGGIKEESISVSTNGWVSFRNPAWDYWNHTQPYDYRGVPAVVGELERGIMPYWDDLDVGNAGAGTGTVTEVVAPDNSWVAFQWDLGQHDGGTPRRSFQLVLFPDGSFRFDYPGENKTGGSISFIGYSLGTGASSADVVAENTQSVPATSLLFTPKTLSPAGPTQPGTVSTTLPKRSLLLSADAGCALTTAPTATATGLVTCDVPALDAGQQTARNVTFAMPGKAPGYGAPANFRFLGTYTAGPIKLTDGDEIDALSTSLEPTTINIETIPPAGSVETGVPMTFKVQIKAQGSRLDEPTAVFEVKHSTISSVKIAGQELECSPLGGSTATCVLPSGSGSDEVELIIIPDNDKTVEVMTTAQALNAPPETRGLGILTL